jgi:hypothetical protein
MGAGHNGYSIPGIDLKIKKEGGRMLFLAAVQPLPGKNLHVFLIYFEREEVIKRSRGFTTQ